MSSAVRVIDRPAGDELHVLDARWSVLTDDADKPGAICLRVVSHDQDIEDGGAGLRLLFTYEQAEALLVQLQTEVLPYYVELVKGNGDDD